MKKLIEYGWAIRIGNFKNDIPYFVRGVFSVPMPTNSITEIGYSILVFEDKKAACDHNMNIRGRIVKVKIEEEPLL